MGTLANNEDQDYITQWNAAFYQGLLCLIR